MDTFEKLLVKATEFHGHLCSGQVLGVRVAVLGLRELAIADPYGTDQKKLVVFVEVARCFADAIMMVTGCRVGKRSFKLVDCGKFAATFVNMETGRAVRVSLRSGVWEKIRQDHPDLDERKAEKQGYREMSDDELFAVQEVAVTMKPEDTPGVPIVRAICADCGDAVIDRREIVRAGRPLCPNCASGGSYFTAAPAARSLKNGKDGGVTS